MNILEDTFHAHERLAPDTNEVLREIRRTAARRHRRAAPRALAVAGVGATVAAVAAGSVVLGRTDAPRTAQPTSAAATHHVTPQPKPKPKVAPAEPRLPGPDHSTFGAGWLPSDTVSVSLASNSLRWGQEIEYDMSVDGQPVTVLIQYNDATSLEDRSKSGPGDGSHGVFDGHPSVVWDAGGYWKLTYQRDAAHTVIVEVIVGDNAQGSGAGVIGRHVTGELRFDLDTPIDPGGYLTYLPDGVHLSAVSSNADFGIAWQVAADGSRSERPLIQNMPLNQKPNALRVDGPQAYAKAGTAGRPVQGHESYVDQHGTEITLTVPGLLPGKSVEFFSSPAVPTLAELYAIADGLRAS